MKSGTAGPAGVVAVVLVLGAQAAALATFVGDVRSAVIAGAAVCASRAALWITCAGPVPAGAAGRARRDLHPPGAGLVGAARLGRARRRCDASSTRGAVRWRSGWRRSS